MARRASEQGFCTARNYTRYEKVDAASFTSDRRIRVAPLRARASDAIAKPGVSAMSAHVLPAIARSLE
jgi:hypothetical protein